MCARHVVGARDANQSSTVARGQPTVFAPIRCGSGKLPERRQRQIVTAVTPNISVTSFVRRKSGGLWVGVIVVVPSGVMSGQLVKDGLLSGENVKDSNNVKLAEAIRSYNRKSCYAR